MDAFGTKETGFFAESSGYSEEFSQKNPVSDYPCVSAMRLTAAIYTQVKGSNFDRPSIKCYLTDNYNLRSATRKLCCLCPKIDKLTISS